MHAWMLLRFALMMLAFGVVLVIAFLADGPDGRRDPAAKSREAHDTHEDDALSPH